MAGDRSLVYTITINDNGTAVIRNFNGQIIKGNVALKDLDKTLLKLNTELGATTNGFNAQAKAIREARDAAIIGSAEYKKLDSQLLKLKTTQQQLIGNSKGQGLTGVSAASGSASASVLEMGRVISDSNYGIRGVANNLSQLASNMVYTSKAAGGFVLGLKQIWSAMIGPLGILLAIQFAIAMLEKWSMTTDKA